MSFVKSTCFRKAGHRGATIMYSIWKMFLFFYFKPHKHIALHQIHKIMLFLAMSYDPFKSVHLVLSIYRSIYRSINLSFYVTIYCSFVCFISIYLLIVCSMSVCVTIVLSFHLSIISFYLSFYVTIVISFYLSYISICRSICLSVCSYQFKIICSAFYDTIVAKQLYWKLRFYNRFIYCRNLIYLTCDTIWLILYIVWGVGIIFSQVFGHLGSFKGWIQTEACVIPSYGRNR